MSKTPLTDHYTKRLRNFCGDEFVPIEFARKLERELTAVTEQRDRLAGERDELKEETLESMYAKVVAVALECDPIPAKDRADGKIEPPWEVFARVKRERDRLAEACKLLMGVIGDPNASAEDWWATEDEINAAWNSGNEALAVKGEHQ
jgi:hypothetical protein